MITHEKFLPIVNVLRDFKNATGRCAISLTLQEIKKDFNYKSGRDLPEKIKMAIAERHRSHRVRYVVLVGDEDMFPIRYCLSQKKQITKARFSYQPSDLYYADLFKADGSFDTWDNNHNGLFCEWSRWDPINVDDVDYHPDVALGRIPASNYDELIRYVKKVIQYESTPERAEKKNNRAIFISSADVVVDADASTIDYVDIHGVINDFEAFTEDSLISGEEIIRLYDDRISNLEQTDAPAGLWLQGTHAVHDYIIQRLSEGVSLMAYTGHGKRRSWAGTLSGTRLNTYDQDIDYNYYPPVVIGHACDTALYAPNSNEDYMDQHGEHILESKANSVTLPPTPSYLQLGLPDKTSLAEDMLFPEKGGAIAYMAPYSYGNSQTIVFTKNILKGLYMKDGVTLGDAWKYMIEKYYDHYDLDNIQPKWDSHNGEWSWRPGENFHHGRKVLLMGDPSVVYRGLANNISPQITSKLLNQLHNINKFLRALVIDSNSINEEAQITVLGQLLPDNSDTLLKQYSNKLHHTEDILSKNYDKIECDPYCVCVPAVTGLTSIIDSNNSRVEIIDGCHGEMLVKFSCNVQHGFDVNYFENNVCATMQ